MPPFFDCLAIVTPFCEDSVFKTPAARGQTQPYTVNAHSPPTTRTGQATAEQEEIATSESDQAPRKLGILWLFGLLITPVSSRHQALTLLTMVGPKGSGGSQAGASPKNPISSGPSECASRDRASDAADAVKEMAQMLNQMNPDVVRRLVHAREAAANIQKAFPGGDQRFAPVEWDSDDEEGVDEEEDEEEVNDGDDDGGAGGEPCQGLLDDRMDSNPLECLERVKREYDFDVVGEMDVARLDFFERIRLVNYLRRIVKEGAQPAEAVRRVRSVLETRDRSVLGDEALLEPVVKGDVLLTVLETEEEFGDGELDEKEEVIDAVKDSLREAQILS